MKLFTRLRNRKVLRYVGLALTVVVALLAAAVVASVLPAARAARVDVMQALRSD